MWFWLFWVCFPVTILLIFYVRWLLKTIETMNEETKEVSSMIFDFAEHVKTVYELPMFYGDETLSSLLEHARAVVENINEIDFILEEEEEEVSLTADSVTTIEGIDYYMVTAYGLENVLFSVEENPELVGQYERETGVIKGLSFEDE